MKKTTKQKILDEFKKELNLYVKRLVDLGEIDNYKKNIGGFTLFEFPTGERIISTALDKVAKQSEEDTLERVGTILSDLTQKHDCDNDTACKFEDRLFTALDEIDKLNEK